MNWMNAFRTAAQRIATLTLNVPRWPIALLIAVLSSMNVACASTSSWEEEAQLHDGNIIVVKRSITLGTNMPREIGQGAGLSNETLDFTAPDGRNIHWEEPGRLALMILDFQDGVPYLAASPRLGRDEAYYKCPEPNYVFFKYVGQWERINFDAFPVEFRNTNLMIDTQSFVESGQSRFQKLSPERIRKKNGGMEKSELHIDPNYKSYGCTGVLNYGAIK